MIFNKESVYDKEISPLMRQIIGICKREKIPVLASFCYRGYDDGGVDYCTTALPGGEFQPDEFREAARIIRNGASTRPKALAITITER